MKKLKLLCVVILVLVKTISESVSTKEVSRLQENDATTGGLLYPRATQTRDVRTLDGIWNFRQSPATDHEAGYKNGWFKQDLAKTGDVIPMPVPSSYNDIGPDDALRDNVGPVWYDRRFLVPAHWSDQRRIHLRFSSVNYDAHVWVNGVKVAYHDIGHLPFEADITEQVKFNVSNLLTVAVNNSLRMDTVPQGNTSMDKITYSFDFFNYAGIHRTVFLYSTPQTYIDDVTVTTTTKGSSGIVDYKISHKSSLSNDVKCEVELLDKNDTTVKESKDCTGSLEVSNAHLWWPYQMNPNPGYLYTIKTSLTSSSGDIVDTYYQKIGIRTVESTETSVTINGKSIYFRGFGMHEDSDLRGRGWDPVLWVKNFNLIRWTGANAFRTSHYPYAEEIYQLADEQGIMVIDECPSVNTYVFSDALREKHKRSLTELVRRDRNHPSVIMWSVANEPVTQNPASEAYFKGIVEHVKSLDNTRPVTMAIAQWHKQDHAAQFVDVLSFNRYNAWYEKTGLNEITEKVVNEAADWHTMHKKPVIMSEYGADTIAGMHSLPEEKWSEEYQLALMSEHFKAFDQLRLKGYFVGEFIWHFADFNCKQAIRRVGGNRKGVFTRSRRPKAAAHHLRARYRALAAAEYKQSPPDLDYYISDKTCTKCEL